MFAQQSQCTHSTSTSPTPRSTGTPSTGIPITMATRSPSTESVCLPVRQPHPERHTYRQHRAGRLHDNVTGCTDTTFRLLQIYRGWYRNSTLTGLAGCNPLTVNFSNNSSGLSTYLWEFGDGSTHRWTTTQPHVYGIHTRISQNFLPLGFLQRMPLDARILRIPS